MSESISVLAKEPGKPFIRLTCRNTLKELQSLVCGPIETVTIASDAVVICNEEGRLKDLPFNCEICGIGFVGNILIAGVDGDEFADVPEVAEKLFASYK